MFSKRSTLLATAFAVLFVVSTLPLAAQETTSGTVQGTVQQMDAKAGTLTLRSEDGRMVELTAPATLLHDLQTGDAVEVRTSGNQVTTITMKGAPPAVQPMQPDGSYQRSGPREPSMPPRTP
jgi:Cu/Ag efflux protein CusF